MRSIEGGGAPSSRRSSSSSLGLICARVVQASVMRAPSGPVAGRGRGNLVRERPTVPLLRRCDLLHLGCRTIILLVSECLQRQRGLVAGSGVRGALIRECARPRPRRRSRHRPLHSRTRPCSLRAGRRLAGVRERRRTRARTARVGTRRLGRIGDSAESPDGRSSLPPGGAARRPQPDMYMLGNTSIYAALVCAGP